MTNFRASSFSRIVLLVVALGATAFATLPLLWTVLASVRPANEIFSSLSTVSWKLIVPTSFKFDNYIGVLTGPFVRSVVNSIIIAAISVAVGLVVSAMAAFASAALKFRGRNFVFGCIVLSFLIPFEAIAIPLSQTFREFGLANSYIGLILPAVGNGLAVFLLRQFFLGVPSELNEAARLDGLGWQGVLWRIYVPLSKAPLVGAGLIIFIFQWQSFLWPLLIAPKPNLAVAAVAVADFAQQDRVDFGQMFAASTITVIIPLLLVLLFQRQFTDPVGSTGNKE